MKLKTKIVHSFNIETNVMDGFEFTLNTPDIKKKTIIKEIKLKKKKDVSTGLF